MAVAIGRDGLYRNLIFGFRQEQCDARATDRRALRVSHITLNATHRYSGRTANLGVLQAAGTFPQGHDEVPIGTGLHEHWNLTSRLPWPGKRWINFNEVQSRLRRA